MQFAVVDYDPGTHDLKTRSLHYFEDDKITKVVEFIIKTSAVVTKILNLSQNVVFTARIGCDLNKSYC